MYALIDCNNFYVSCERIFNPQLNKQPIVVLSNNDGCVISRSEEAKKLNIPMGAAAYQFRSLFEKENVKVFSSNYCLYADISERVMNILQEFTPDIEIYSIDESFLQFSGYDEYFTLQEIALKIQHRITQGLNMPICIGIAPTKALAKVANRIAKKFPHISHGTYTIDTEEKRIKALKWLKIEDVWGIGRRLSARLRSLNINTAYDFTQLNDHFIQKEFSILELRLKKELLGESVLKLEDVKNKKSIATTRSFEKDEDDYEFIKERIITFTVSCAEKLRNQKSLAQTVTVLLQTNPQKDVPQYRRTIVLQLPYATNSSLTLVKYSQEALHQIFRSGYKYKRAGVIFSGLINSNTKQLNLFEEENTKHNELMKTIDSLNKKIGEPKIKLGGQDLEKTWKMKQDHLSKKYTTNITEIIEVNLNLA